MDKAAIFYGVTLRNALRKANGLLLWMFMLSTRTKSP